MRALKRLRASKRLLRRRHTAQRRRAARGLAVTAVVTAVTMVLTSSAAHAATRSFGSWGCSTHRFATLEHVAASPATGSIYWIQAYVQTPSGLYPRTWTQPDAATYKYRLIQTPSHTGTSAWLQAAYIERAAGTCIF